MDCETTVLDSVDAVRAYIDQCFSNSSLKENYRKVFEEHIEKTSSNSAWLNSTLVGLTFVYILMMCIGFTGNILVMIVIICNRAMRVSPRNLFIFNLAVSDLILCIVTQPLNLYRILSTRHGWQLGLLMCKLSSMVQATNVYVSSMSITAIALDRFRLIMNPSRQDINVKTVYVIICFLWLLAFTLSTPIGVFARVSTANGRPTCSEATLDYSMRITKLVYSILGMILLYGTPVTLVSIAYAQICILVHKRIKKKPRHSQPYPLGSKSLHVHRENTDFSGVQESSPNRTMPAARVSDVGSVCVYFLQRKLTDDPANVGVCENRMYTSQRHPSRHRRTSFLLASVSIFFAISWLPLNIVNLLLDLRELNFEVLSVNQSTGWEDRAPSLPVATPFVPRGRSDDYLSLPGETVLIIQAVCLLFVLISACINPMLYGWLNENFRRRFKQLLRCPHKRRYLVESEKQKHKTWQVSKKRSPYALWPKACRRRCDRRQTSDQLSASTYHPTSQKTSSVPDAPRRSHSLDVIVYKSSMRLSDGALAFAKESNLPRGVLLETDIDAK
ncbi:Neuropeptide F receptor [Echinococcus granulosus]|uniref:G protein coupled receptor n=1 Tax=Echinococcus granulosus TaxID=6210 RepID=A0A068W877_ECHGR|nr:Neuropeptide F receptor [Echinococcus granulosus]CDS16100.1 g protein coupled receptor [Echinococcus granulosus]